MRNLGTLLVIAFGGLAMSVGTAAAQSAAEEKTAAAEKVCLQAVSERTGNDDVTVIKREFDEMVTSVTVGVGTDQKPWRCVVEDRGGGDQYIQSIIEE